MEAQSYNTRRLARSFTPQTPMHHPLLDPELPEEDVSLVPQDLCPRGHLKWELPKKARTNLHIMLKLSNKTDELMDEFHEKIPYIDEVLHEWAEMRGASPTREGREQMRAQSLYHSDCWKNEEIHRTGNNDDYVFNMVRNLDSPGRADIIYLTDVVEDADSDTMTTSNIPSNIEGTDWLETDSPNVDMQAMVNSENVSCAYPEPLHVRKVKRSDSTPSNLRISDWDSDQSTILTSTVYSPETEPDREESPKPFEEFWRDHEVPFGPQVVLGGNDYNEPMASLTPRPESPKPCGSPQTPSQDVARLMVPAQIC